ncbi:MAG TPA: hypothetical protein VEX60_04645 [Pyrinomonadaceae bacterium]|nr:hypothetical protein [Pyrinomonadaceae bacterium]
MRARAATGLVLLVLMAHAFVASTSHFHRLAGATAPVYSGAALSANEESQDAPPAGGHAQCLVCRLQRNFVSDLQQLIPVVAAPPATAQVFETHTDTSVHSVRFLSPSGRAPPHA